ncbi:MAG: hypothetical protein WAK92_01525 [Thiobacillus sp.]
MNIRLLKGAALSALIWALGSTVHAGDFDGSKLLICAPVQAMECYAGEECKMELPEAVGAPAFMRIDFNQRRVVGPKRSSAIETITADERQLLMQGIELGHAWSLALNYESGKMILTLAGNDVAFVLFGACTPQ